MHEHNGRRGIVGEATLQQVKLGFASDEPIPIAIRELGGECHPVATRSARRLRMPLIPHDPRSVAARVALRGPSCN